MAWLNTRQVGAEYETVAAEYLIGKGYKILERNYANPYGEIDIIARKGKAIVYIEVKFRNGSQYGGPLEAVDVRKQRRISRAAAWHYAELGAFYDMPCQFDVIGIYEDGSLCHVENAFDYQGPEMNF